MRWGKSGKVKGIYLVYFYCHQKGRLKDFQTAFSQERLMY
ncbi:hypothetical protein NEIFLAOT_01701 [Neisseria flavescens NRL30031/H210]|uniref:Uncharacterized protein n=1 Tax=Neisseria flavescens NRL30031/H210 TaxID=546264 RepID=C0EP11_NEIFL|nr:hypothetical protein NEIFLAOT_01701 [Neisseria flavescens NRL30031/H210]